MRRLPLAAPHVVLVAVAALLSPHATGPSAEEPLDDAASEPDAATPPPTPDLLFFYYGWYGGGADGRHWADGTTDRPIAGYYDSHRYEDTRDQLAAIRDSGGTGIVMSWWGRDSFEDRSLRVALDAHDETGVEVTASFETWAYQFRKASAERLAEQMEHVWHEHASRPGWLRVDDKPVLFVHAACLHDVEKWDKVVRILREKGIEFYLYGEIRDPKDAPTLYRVFDGLYFYMPIELQKGRVFGNANREMQEHANASGREWVPTVAPAYDNSNDRLKRHHLVVDEEDGALVREGMREALRLEPRFILLATWNEWAEGTSYEPGERDQGRRLAAVHEVLREHRETATAPAET